MQAVLEGVCRPPNPLGPRDLVYTMVECVVPASAVVRRAGVCVGRWPEELCGVAGDRWKCGLVLQGSGLLPLGAAMRDEAVGRLLGGSGEAGPPTPLAAPPTPLAATLAMGGGEGAAGAAGAPDDCADSLPGMGDSEARQEKGRGAGRGAEGGAATGGVPQPARGPAGRQGARISPAATRPCSSGGTGRKRGRAVASAAGGGGLVPGAGGCAS